MIFTIAKDHSEEIRMIKGSTVIYHMKVLANNLYHFLLCVDTLVAFN